MVSASFVQYVHLNVGAPQGDYGLAYRHIIEKGPVLWHPERTFDGQPLARPPR